MAAGAWKVYGAADEAIHKGTIDLDSDHFRLVLVTSSYTPDQDADDTWSDVSTNEVANGNGYATHGKALTQTVTRSNKVTTFDVDDQSWTASTITAKYAVIVKDADNNGALAAGDLLVAYSDLEGASGSLSSSAGAFSVTINASGVFTSTVA